MPRSSSISTSVGTRSRATSGQSQFDYDPSISSGELRREQVHEMKTDKKRSSVKPGWMSQVKSWLATSEPSAQAMKAQKKAAYKKHGIDMKDPRAAAKMHFPLGKVPADAITSTSGPTPEKAFKEKVREKQNRPSYMKHSQGTHSMSSGFSSVPSVKSSRGFNPVAPWDE
ncbi:hypothetical protein PT974_11438 [Cladobotryum mycophilum]|uniref:Uncharacterized protein n=1 Tax=Cladobotryum mycophilum TaxID=491253 RepID=A0ABR0S599_9HYPO